MLENSLLGFIVKSCLIVLTKTVMIAIYWNSNLILSCVWQSAVKVICFSFLYIGLDPILLHFYIFLDIHLCARHILPDVKQKKVFYLYSNLWWDDYIFFVDHFEASCCHLLNCFIAYNFAAYNRPVVNYGNWSGLAMPDQFIWFSLEKAAILNMILCAYSQICNRRLWF